MTLPLLDTNQPFSQLKADQLQTKVEDPLAPV